MAMSIRDKRGLLNLAIGALAGIGTGIIVDMIGKNFGAGPATVAFGLSFAGAFVWAWYDIKRWKRCLDIALAQRRVITKGMGFQYVPEMVKVAARRPRAPHPLWCAGRVDRSLSR